MCGNIFIPITPALQYTITVNDIVVKKDEKLPEYLFQDMTDNTGKNVSIIDEDYLLELLPDLLIADNVTINIKCTRKQVDQCINSCL